jgi:hypothetical protein
VLTTGYIPRWDGTSWGQVENHKGEKGRLNGVETEITEYGPLPDGWATSPPPPTLEEAKAAKLKEINAAKWAAVEGGEVEYENLHFHTDSASQGLLASAVTMHQAIGTLPQVWKAKDGYLPITSVTQLTDIGALVAAFVEAQFEKEFQLAANVNAAETVEDVEAITWKVVYE